MLSLYQYYPEQQVTNRTEKSQITLYCLEFSHVYTVFNSHVESFKYENSLDSLIKKA